jgi:lycopene beta-cyclase
MQLPHNHYDVIIVGGGLAGAMLAWRMAQASRGQNILLLESTATLGGNHTWSFHGGDITPTQQQWLQPFIVRQWSAQQVRFPAFARTLDESYHSISSQQLHAVIMAAELPNLQTRFNAAVVMVQPETVQIAGGENLRASLVVDARGFAPTAHLALGYQKFLGQEVELAAPHGLSAPIIMDATVPQFDGYRFVYVLPFSPTCLLIEDTYYSDGAELPVQNLRERIAVYAHKQGWQITRTLREEQGVLPLALGYNVEDLWRSFRGVPTIGLRGGFFHPVTGYSLPFAVQVADALAALPAQEWFSDPVLAELIALARRQHMRQDFLRFLNRMLFMAAKPGERYKVLQRFYGLSPDLIRRFYADQLDLGDKTRLLLGKPPVPILAAARCMAEASAFSYRENLAKQQAA